MQQHLCRLAPRRVQLEGRIQQDLLLPRRRGRVAGRGAGVLGGVLGLGSRCGGRCARGVGRGGRRPLLRGELGLGKHAPDARREGVALSEEGSGATFGAQVTLLEAAHDQLDTSEQLHLFECLGDARLGLGHRVREALRHPLGRRARHGQPVKRRQGRFHALPELAVHAVAHDLVGNILLLDLSFERVHLVRTLLTPSSLLLLIDHKVCSRQLLEVIVCERRVGSEQSVKLVLECLHLGRERVARRALGHGRVRALGRDLEHRLRASLLVGGLGQLQRPRHIRWRRRLALAEGVGHRHEHDTVRTARVHERRAWGRRGRHVGNEHKRRHTTEHRVVQLELDWVLDSHERAHDSEAVLGRGGDEVAVGREGEGGRHLLVAGIRREGLHRLPDGAHLGNLVHVQLLVLAECEDGRGASTGAPIVVARRLNDGDGGRGECDRGRHVGVRHGALEHVEQQQTALDARGHREHQLACRCPRDRGGHGR